MDTIDWVCKEKSHLDQLKRSTLYRSTPRKRWSIRPPAPGPSGTTSEHVSGAATGSRRRGVGVGIAHVALSDPLGRMWLPRVFTRPFIILVMCATSTWYSSSTSNFERRLYESCCCPAAAVCICSLVCTSLMSGAWRAFLVFSTKGSDGHVGGRGMVPYTGGGKQRASSCSYGTCTNLVRVERRQETV